MYKLYHTVKLITSGDKVAYEKRYMHSPGVAANSFIREHMGNIVARKILKSGKAALQIFDDDDILMWTINLHKI